MRSLVVGSDHTFDALDGHSFSQQTSDHVHATASRYMSMRPEGRRSVLQSPSSARSSHLPQPSHVCKNVLAIRIPPSISVLEYAPQNRSKPPSRITSTYDESKQHGAPTYHWAPVPTSASQSAQHRASARSMLAKHVICTSTLRLRSSFQGASTERES